MTLSIRHIGDPVLRQVAQPIEPEELATPRWQAFIDELVATMRQANGAGLAAIQVGRPVRIVAIEVRAGNPRYPWRPAFPLLVAVNPRIEPLGGETYPSYEGCLSVPNLRGLVTRHRRIAFEYLDRHGQPHRQVLEGFAAGTAQHECDHLDGILFVDRVEDPRTLCTDDNFRRYREGAYLEELRQMGLIPAAS